MKIEKKVGHWQICRRRLLKLPAMLAVLYNAHIALRFRFFFFLILSFNLVIQFELLRFRVCMTLISCMHLLLRLFILLNDDAT